MQYHYSRFLSQGTRCPFEAIAIINLPTNLESQVTHRYTANAFKLHRLPTPRPGQVLGLVGTNGIGKSTALKILAGKLKPNLGRYDVRILRNIQSCLFDSNRNNAGPSRLAGNLEILPGLRIAELLHKGLGGQLEGPNQASIRRPHPESHQGNHVRFTDA